MNLINLKTAPHRMVVFHQLFSNNAAVSFLNYIYIITYYLLECYHLYTTHHKTSSKMFTVSTVFCFFITFFKLNTQKRKQISSLILIVKVYRKKKLMFISHYKSYLHPTFSHECVIFLI